MKKETKEKISKLEVVGAFTVAFIVCLAIGFFVMLGSHLYSYLFLEGYTVLPDCNGYLFWGEANTFNAKILSCRD